MKKKERKRETMGPDFEKCPACQGPIDLDDVDVNNNDENGYGEMVVYHTCPHCGAELHVCYDAQNGYDFKYIELA